VCEPDAGTTQDRRKVFLEVTPEAVDLGWSFFGPLINAAVAGMRSFTDAELTTVHRFLDIMIDVAAAQRAVPAGRDARST
jgi:hypothetical protein